LTRAARARKGEEVHGCRRGPRATPRGVPGGGRRGRRSRRQDHDAGAVREGGAEHGTQAGVFQSRGRQTLSRIVETLATAVRV